MIYENWDKLTKEDFGKYIKSISKGYKLVILARRVLLNTKLHIL